MSRKRHTSLFVDEPVRKIVARIRTGTQCVIPCFLGAPQVPSPVAFFQTEYFEAWFVPGPMFDVLGAP